MVIRVNSCEGHIVAMFDYHQEIHYGLFKLELEYHYIIPKLPIRRAIKYEQLQVDKCKCECLSNMICHVF